MTDNFDLRNRCSSILDRFVEELPAYIRYDRYRKLQTLKNLAQDLYEKSQKQSSNLGAAASMGTGAYIGTALGAILAGPVGILAGSMAGALFGKTCHTLATTSANDNLSPHINKTLHDKEWKTLLVDPQLSIGLIKDLIIDTLYPKRLHYLDLGMMMALTETRTSTMIETINCDLGIVSEIERFSNRTCISKDLTEFEKSLNNLGHISSRPHGMPTLKIMMLEKIRYENLVSKPSLDITMDMTSLNQCIEELRWMEHLIAIVPRHLLYNPGFQMYRKSWFTEGKLKAIIDVKQSTHTGLPALSSMIFSGSKSDKALLLPDGWDGALKDKVMNPDNINLEFSLRSMLRNQNMLKEWHTISHQSMAKPYIITPSWHSKTSKQAHRLARLGSVVLLEQICKTKFPSVCGIIINSGLLSKDKPLRPISWGSLDIEEVENPTNWYHIETDHVVLLQILNGRVFTGYMENVKGKNFFLQGPGCRIIVLGVNNNSGISPQYLAQTLLSEKDGVCLQLLGADFYAESFNALKSTVLNTYIPVPSIDNQNKAVVETAVQKLNQSNSEWEKKFDEYHRSIRERKHALSQEITAMQGSLKRLIGYCRNCNGNFNLRENIGGASTVEDVIGRLEERIKDMVPLITHLAETDYNFGKCEKFNAITELRNIASGWKDDGITVYEEEFLNSTDKSIRIKFPIRAFQQIFSNIYSNAQIHGFTEDKQNRVIKLSWRLSGDMLFIRVANNGTPLNSASNKEQYHRNNGHKSEGIGNSQIRQLMEEYGGNFSLDSIAEDDFNVAYTLMFKLDQ